MNNNAAANGGEEGSEVDPNNTGAVGPATKGTDEGGDFVATECTQCTSEGGCCSFCTDDQCGGTDGCEWDANAPASSSAITAGDSSGACLSTVFMGGDGGAIPASTLLGGDSPGGTMFGNFAGSPGANPFQAAVDVATAALAECEEAQRKRRDPAPEDVLAGLGGAGTGAGGVDTTALSGDAGSLMGGAADLMGGLANAAAEIMGDFGDLGQAGGAEFSGPCAAFEQAVAVARAAGDGSAGSAGVTAAAGTAAVIAAAVLGTM